MFLVREWLEREGLSYDWVNEDNITIPCPVCGKRRGHFTISVDPKKPYFNCYRCGARGHWASLVVLLSGVSKEDAERLVRSPGFALPREERKKEPPSPEPVELPQKAGFTAEVRDYLRSRRLSDDLVDRLGFYYTREWRYRDRIVLPVFGDKGQVWSFQARAIREGQSPKYLSPPAKEGGGLREYLYYPARRFRVGREVILVEGVFDAVRVRLADPSLFPLAVFGKTVTGSQINLLRESGVESVVLMFDSDAASDVESTWRGLAGYFDVSACVLPPGKDPDDIDEVFLVKNVLGKRCRSVMEFGLARVQMRNESARSRGIFVDFRLDNGKMCDSIP